jgi:hypothetical protein
VTATKAAASRAQSVAAELHVDIGAVAVKTGIKISINNVEENFDAMSDPATCPLTASETQLDFWGPLRTTVRHRGKSHQCDRRLAAYLRRTLA